MTGQIILLIPISIIYDILIFFRFLRTNINNAKYSTKNKIVNDMEILYFNNSFFTEYNKDLYLIQIGICAW